MNNKKIFSVMLVCVLVFITNASLFAQTSGNEQRLVGTWTSPSYPVTITLNADGTMSTTWDFVGMSGGSNNQIVTFRPTHWAAAGNQLVLFQGAMRIRREFQISSDGKTLILIDHMAQYGSLFGSSATPFRRN